MTRKDYSNPALPLPPMPGKLPSGVATAPAGAFYSNTVATHGTVSEGEICCSSRVVSPSHPYNFPPNGNGQNAADRIANAMWEIEK